MTATTTDRLDGLASSTAVKGPCKAASTTNLTLSGEQTVNGVSIVADDRVLVTGQTDGRENGVYVAATSVWRRAKDFSSNNDVREGTQVRVNDGTNAGIYVVSTSDPIVFDTTSITLTRDTALTSGALMAANNLSDVASAVAALWNLRNNGADMTAAATLVLNNATGDQIDVTGNTTITAVTLSEDREVWCRFTGTPQITVGASLVGNAGGANITLAAGDIVRFRGYAAGVVRFTVFRLSGQAVAAPATTTEALTGTDTSKPVTADALAALWEKGSDVASNGTISLGEGSLFHITGTTTITDIDFATAKNGRRATLIFDGALTLTHHATTLLLPGGANITTAAGDRCVVVQDSSDNVYVESYTKANGTAVVVAAAGSMTLLGTLTTTSGTTQSLTGIAAGYRQLYCEFEGCSHDSGGTDGKLQVKLSSTNGAAYGTAADVISAVVNSAQTANGVLTVFNVSSIVAASKWYFSVYTGATTSSATGTVSTNTAAVVDAIRFLWSQGASFDAGTIRVYGVK